MDISKAREEFLKGVQGSKFVFKSEYDVEKVKKWGENKSVEWFNRQLENASGYSTSLTDLFDRWYIQHHKKDSVILDKGDLLPLNSLLNFLVYSYYMGTQGNTFFFTLEKSRSGKSFSIKSVPYLDHKGLTEFKAPAPATEEKKENSVKVMDLLRQSLDVATPAEKTIIDKAIKDLQAYYTSNLKAGKVTKKSKGKPASQPAPASQQASA